MLLCLALQGGKVLVWFRSDLRVHDNPALTHALEEAGTVVPVYCFDPRQFGKTSFGFEKTGTWCGDVLCCALGFLRVSADRWANILSTCGEWSVDGRVLVPRVRLCLTLARLTYIVPMLSAAILYG